MTLAGIQALRSAEAEGTPFEIPDFRDAAARDRYRNDHWEQKHIDPKRIFPDNQDRAITDDFSAAGILLDGAVTNVRKALDAMKVYPLAAAADQIAIINQVKLVRDAAPEYAGIYARARKIVDAYPDSQGGQALRELLVDVGEEGRVMQTTAFVTDLNDWLLQSAAPKQ